MNGSCLFKAGDAVRRRSAPDSVGIVKQVSWDDQAEECRYRVQFSGQVKSVPEGDLRESAGHEGSRIGPSGWPSRRCWSFSTVADV